MIEGVAPGQYSLVVDAKGYSSGVLYNIEIKKDKVRDLGDRLILNVRSGNACDPERQRFSLKEAAALRRKNSEVEKIEARGTSKKGRKYLHKCQRRVHLSPPGRAGKISNYRNIQRRVGLKRST